MRKARLVKAGQASIAALGWIAKLLLVALLLLLGGLGFLLVRESVTRNRYRAEHPPPGEMIPARLSDLAGLFARIEHGPV